MRILAGLCLALLLVACAGAPGSGEPIGASLAGNWVFQVQTGSNVANGAMTLVADGSGYGGTLTTDQGNNVLTVRSVTVDGTAMNMVVESPNGNVIFAGALSPDARSFQGTVTYHTGQNFPMLGNRL